MYFSTRTQGGESRLGKFITAQEAAVLRGNYAWEIHESQADIMKFIDAMSPDQLKVIDGKIKGVNGLTKEKLKDLVKKGEVVLDASMYIAENCSNLSFMINVTDKTKAPIHDNSSDDGTPNTAETETIIFGTEKKSLKCSQTSLLYFLFNAFCLCSTTS